MCVSALLGRVGLSIALFAFLVPLSPLDVRAAEPVIPDYVHRVWTVEHGLPQNLVARLLASRDGSIWIGATNGAARFTFYHRLSRLEAQGVDIPLDPTPG